MNACDLIRVPGGADTTEVALKDDFLAEIKGLGINAAGERARLARPKATLASTGGLKRSFRK